MQTFDLHACARDQNVCMHVVQLPYIIAVYIMHIGHALCGSLTNSALDLADHTIYSYSQPETGTCSVVL